MLYAPFVQFLIPDFPVQEERDALINLWNIGEQSMIHGTLVSYLPSSLSVPDDIRKTLLTACLDYLKPSTPSKLPIAERVKALNHLFLLSELKPNFGIDGYPPKLSVDDLLFLLHHAPGMEKVSEEYLACKEDAYALTNLGQDIKLNIPLLQKIANMGVILSNTEIAFIRNSENLTQLLALYTHLNKINLLTPPLSRFIQKWYTGSDDLQAIRIGISTIENLRKLNVFEDEYWLNLDPSHGFEIHTKLLCKMKAIETQEDARVFLYLPILLRYPLLLRIEVVDLTRDLLRAGYLEQEPQAENSDFEAFLSMLNTLPYHDNSYLYFTQGREILEGLVGRPLGLSGWQLFWKQLRDLGRLVRLAPDEAELLSQRLPLIWAAISRDGVIVHSEQKENFEFCADILEKKKSIPEIVAFCQAPTNRESLLCFIEGLEISEKEGSLKRFLTAISEACKGVSHPALRVLFSEIEAFHTRRTVAILEELPENTCADSLRPLPIIVLEGFVAEDARLRNLRAKALLFSAPDQGDEAHTSSTPTSGNGK